MTTALPAREGAKEIGLVEGHEYLLQEGVETIYKGERIRLLKIRNPWGSINYSGKCCADYDLWNNKLKIYLILAKCENEETWDFSKYRGGCEGQNNCSLNVTVEEGS
jgi:hypothetical protein